MHYRTRYRHPRRQNKSAGFLMPFVLLILVGFIGVMGFKLWGMLFPDQPKSGVYMHLVSGTAEMKTWGTDEFFNVSSDTLLLQGDEVKTSAGAKTIFEFFDGTVMRADGKVDIVFEDFSDDPKSPEIKVLLVNGEIWVNKFYKSTGGTKFSVVTDNVSITSNGTSIFNIDNLFEEAVHVLKGDNLEIDVHSEDDSTVVDSFVIGVGQEVVFTKKVLASFWKFQSPSIIAAISDDFKEREFYEWNIKEDKNPTKFVFDENTGKAQFVDAPPEDLDGDEKEVDEDATEQADFSAEVTVTEKDTEKDDSMNSAISVSLQSVAGQGKNSSNVYDVSARVTTIVGAASGEVVKVTVNDYELQKFKKGDSSWTYFANADYGLMKPGENTYTVVAYDANGKKSAPLVVKVNYKPHEGTVLPKATEEIVKPETTGNNE